MMNKCFLLIILIGINLKFIFFIDISVNAEVVPNAPADITPYGTLKNIESQVLHLPSGYEFPISDDKRKFNQKWLNDYVWLEYSISKNATFCYACQQFSPNNERDNVFKSSGFSNWKSALESNKGFKKHQSSAMHLSSMGKWTEAINRQKTNTSVIELGSGNVLKYRRNYVTKIIEVCFQHLLFINKYLMSKYFLRLLFF